MGILCLVPFYSLLKKSFEKLLKVINGNYSTKSSNKLLLLNVYKVE